MSTTIDARGLACPHPVVLTKKALEEADEVTTIVDNETAKENISRLAASQGCQVSIEEKEEGIYLQLTKKATGTEESPVTPVSGATLLLIASDTLGRGEEELGDILMRSFIHTLSEVTPKPNRIIFINSGVKLVAKGSEVIDDLHALKDQGIEILACGTCLGYYNLKEAVEVGQISNMYDITSALLQAGKIIAI
jgi:selenium metabolism protein YedF